MTSVALGIHAYKRVYAGEPEIQLVNRFVEATPSPSGPNPSLASRSGTGLLSSFAGDLTTNAVRGLYSLPGLFNNDLFVVVGTKLYRYAQDGTKTAITAIIGGTGRPFLTWDKGLTYQRLFISDGQLLNYYDGGTHASGVMTASVTPTNQVVQIGPTYYTWSALVNAGTPNGTSGNPFRCLLTSDPILSLANTLNFIGVSGTDFSSTISAPNTQVTAVSNAPIPATTLTLTSIGESTATNSIVTAVTGTAGLSWANSTLLGGGIHTVHGIAVPTGEGINALTNLNHFIMCQVSNTFKIFYIRPGAITIAALDYASKESNPDPIVDMVTVGDFVYVLGTGSTEVWYATGQNANPLAPQLGRATARGALAGTAVNVKDDVLLVGNDGVVYSMTNGPIRISDNAIEERIRTQLRREKGLT